jgi:serine/threonine protein kinase/Tfp pilus assembly protein PilF
MKCLECDFENPENTRFCGQCGSSLAETDDPRTLTLQTPLEQLRIGSVFADRYQIIEELGIGGMGIVYKVFDKEINEKMALKLLHPAISAEEKMIERFRNEMKTARKISHRNICRMYDLGDTEGTRYITMEYVPGEDLKSSIRRMGPLSAGKAVFIAKQVCEGLAEAHKQGIIHRDLKSRNIMIDKEGNVRIMDFGIARFLEAEDLTDPGVAVGTPKYMSPEQVEGKKADGRSDIYSLGVILYEMVTGKVPFDGDTALSIALKHKTDTPQAPKELNPLIPEGLNQTILKCLEKDREKRYQNPEELFLDLIEIEEELPATDQIVPDKKGTVEIPRQRLRLIAAASILFLIAALVIVGNYVLMPVLIPEQPRWKNSIAVLLFSDRSPKKDQEILCFGMTNAIIGNLAQIKVLKVPPISAVQRYQDEEIDIKKIADDLDVIHILKGNIQQEERITRVGVSLIEAKTETVIWSDDYDSNRESVFEIQDEISPQISDALKAEILPDAVEYIEAKKPRNPEVRQFYKKGNYFEWKYRSSQKEEYFDNAIKHQREAIRLDPDYALAYVGLGDIYEARWVFSDDENYKDLMLMNYRKAYELNPNLGEANIGLGWVHFNLEDLEEAYKYFKKALEIKPNDFDINFNVGSFLISIGLYRQAIDYYSTAIELDPSSFFPYWLISQCHIYIGEYDEAREWIKKAMEMEPPGSDKLQLQSTVVESLLFQGKYDQAEQELRQAEKIRVENSLPEIRSYQAWVSAAKGEKEKALALIEGTSLIYRSSTSIFALLDMKDKVFKYINEGIKTGFEKAQTYIYTYPVLIHNHCYDGLRDDPRFEEILKKLKKIHEERKKRCGDL